MQCCAGGKQTKQKQDAHAGPETGETQAQTGVNWVAVGAAILIVLMLLGTLLMR